MNPVQCLPKPHEVLTAVLVQVVISKPYFINSEVNSSFCPAVLFSSDLHVPVDKLGRLYNQQPVNGTADHRYDIPDVDYLGAASVSERCFPGESVLKGIKDDL